MQGGCPTKRPLVPNVSAAADDSWGIGITTSPDGINWTKDAERPYPVNLTNPGEMSAIGASVVGYRIHFWLTDNYDERYAVRYFYYEPRLEENHPSPSASPPIDDDLSLK